MILYLCMAVAVAYNILLFFLLKSCVRVVLRAVTFFHSLLYWFLHIFITFFRFFFFSHFFFFVFICVFIYEKVLFLPRGIYCSKCVYVLGHILLVDVGFFLFFLIKYLFFFFLFPFLFIFSNFVVFCYSNFFQC